MNALPLSLEQVAARTANENYRALEAEVIATVRGKLTARKMTLNANDLEEAYNQAWHGVCELISRGEEIKNLTGMLVKIMWWRAVDLYRSASPAQFEDVEIVDRGFEPDMAAELDDRDKLRRLIDRLKGRLNQRECEAVSLCLIHGYSRPDAAKLLELDEPVMQRLMDGAMKKVGGIVASLSARGCGDDEWARLMRAYAFGVLSEDDRDYQRAAEHISGCEPCRRYVMGLRGLAAVVPPVGPLLPLFGHETSILEHLHRLFGAHGGASAIQASAIQTSAGATAAAGGGGLSAGWLGGGVAVKGAAVLAVATLTATAVHVTEQHHSRPRHAHSTRHLARSAASTPAPQAYPLASSRTPAGGVGGQSGRPSQPARTRGSTEAQATVAVNREFGPESAASSAQSTGGSPATPQPAPARAASRQSTRATSSREEASAEKEFGP